MLLPHRGHRGGRHERGRPSVSPARSLVPVSLYLDIPPGSGGYVPHCSSGPSQRTGMGIYGWDVGRPSCARCPHIGAYTMSILHYQVWVC